MNKLVKSGLTVAAALGMLVGAAATANANVGIQPLSAGGWANCTNRGLPLVTGTLGIQGTLFVEAPGDGLWLRNGVRGDSLTRRGTVPTGNWNVWASTGSFATGNMICD